MHAAVKGHADAVQALLDVGADRYTEVRAATAFFKARDVIVCLRLDPVTVLSVYFVLCVAVMVTGAAVPVHCDDLLLHVPRTKTPRLR